MEGESVRGNPDVPGGACQERSENLRCHCSNLLARITEEGVEIKCRRCKRLTIVPLVNSPDGRHKR